MKSLLSKVKQVYNSIVGTNNVIGTITTTGASNTGTITTSSNTVFTGMSGTTSTYTTWNTDAEDTAKRRLKRRLWAIQHNKTWVHEMDDDMFDSVCSMLTSEIKADNEIAKEIIFNSKMCLRYRKHFANTFRRVLEPTKFEKMGFKMSGGNYYTTSINPNYYTTTNAITVGTGTGILNSITTSGTTLVAKKACK